MQHGTARIWKPLGKTPLEAVEVWREKKGIAKDVPIAYAGRLDPMAEGVLLLLLGDECKKVAEYRNLDKEYEVEVLLGASTDTGDLLGLVKNVSHNEEAAKIYASEPEKFTTFFSYVSRYRAPKFLQHIFLRPPARQLQKTLQKFLGTHEWEYPVFSSKTVQGKPLFRWFYEGRIEEVDIPKRQVTVYSVTYRDMRYITRESLLKEIHTRIAKVTKVDDASKEWGNDFRRADVLARWGDVCDAHFCIAKIRVACSSGTYMRTLAEKIGHEMGLPACAFSITRTKVGVYNRWRFLW